MNTINKSISITMNRTLIEFLTEKRSKRLSKNGALCDLLEKAEKCFISPFLNNQWHELHYGQCQITISDLAKTWGWHRSTVRTFLEGLERIHVISRERLSQSEVITISSQVHSNEEVSVDRKPSLVERIKDILSPWEGGHSMDEDTGTMIEELIASEENNLFFSKSQMVGHQLGQFHYNQVGHFSYIDKEIVETVCAAALRRALRLFGDKTAMDSQIFVQHFHDQCNHNWGTFLHDVSATALLLVDDTSEVEDLYDAYGENAHLLLNHFRGVIGNILNRDSSKNYQPSHENEPKNSLV